LPGFPFIVIVFNLKSKEHPVHGRIAQQEPMTLKAFFPRDFFVVPPLMLLLKAKHDRFLLDEKAAILLHNSTTL
jgi:hypothetical protein